MKPYEELIINAFEVEDHEFLLELLRYAPSYEEEHIEDIMIDLNICPNCANKLTISCDEEVHGYDVCDPLIEQFRYKKCTTCHWE